MLNTIQVCCEQQPIVMLATRTSGKQSLAIVENLPNLLSFWFWLSGLLWVPRKIEGIVTPGVSRIDLVELQHLRR